MHADMLRDPGMGGMVQHFHLTPLFVKLRFGMWNEILADDGPPADLPYMRAMWYAARGMALAARGERAGAEREHAAVAELKDRPELKTLFISSVNTAYSIVAIADELLQADIARSRGLVKETRDFHLVRRGARGPSDLHGAARLADSGPAVAGRGAARGRTRGGSGSRLRRQT